MFLGAHPGTPYFPPALGWSYCVHVLCVLRVPTVCATEPGSQRMPCANTQAHVGTHACTELTNFQRLPGMTLLCVELRPHRMSQSRRRAETCPQEFSVTVLVCLDCGAELPGVKPQPGFLLVASGLWLKL